MWKGFVIFCATLVSFAQGFGPLALVRLCEILWVYGLLISAGSYVW